MTAPTTGRVVRFNPGNPRHRWHKDEEHHKTCEWCGIHVENRQGARNQWFQVYTWPAGTIGRSSGHTYGGGAVPHCPGPPVVEPVGRPVAPISARSLSATSPNPRAYRYPCLGKAGHCPQKGRLYAIGTWCDDCVPHGRSVPG